MKKEEIVQKALSQIRITDGHGELGEYISNAMDEYAKQREQYWKARCLAAEDYISATPCDPDITNEQILSGEKWQSLKNQEDQLIEQQNKK